MNALDLILSETSAKPSGAERWEATCPAHGTGTNRALSVAVRDDKILLHCFAGCELDNVLAALGLELHDLFNGERTDWQPSRRIAPPQPTLDKVSAWRAEWERASASHPLLSRYLTARGLAVTPPAALRIGYFRDEPYMLARVENVNSELQGLHRTPLAPDGSRREGDKKLAKGSRVTGCAIRLYDATEQLAVAEGVETALAVRQLTGWPTWSAISAGGLAALELPDGVREVLVCADNDTAGINGAHTLARRLAALGLTVRLSIPPRAGDDWLDELIGGAA